MEQSLLVAFSLVLVIEGVLPFVAPSVWRGAFARIMSLSDGQLRFAGLASMVGGLGLLAVLR